MNAMNTFFFAALLIVQVGTNLSIIACNVWSARRKQQAARQAAQPKPYQHILGVLEEDQGAWYVEWLLTAEYTNILRHYQWAGAANADGDFDSEDGKQNDDCGDGGGGGGGAGGGAAGDVDSEGGKQNDDCGKEVAKQHDEGQSWPQPWGEDQFQAAIALPPRVVRPRRRSKRPRARAARARRIRARARARARAGGAVPVPAPASVSATLALGAAGGSSSPDSAGVVALS